MAEPAAQRAISARPERLPRERFSPVAGQTRPGRAQVARQLRTFVAQGPSQSRSSRRGSPTNPVVPDARGEFAWIVDARETTAGLLMPRLQRLGWSTVQFNSCTEVLRRLRGSASAGT